MATATANLRIRITAPTTREALASLVKALEACKEVEHYEIATIKEDA